MSLHAQLSPEALAALQAQKRNSTISSVAIAILSIVLVALVLGYILLPSLLKNTPQIVTYTASLDDEDELSEKKVNNTVKRTPAAPSSSMAKVIASNTISTVAIPVPDTDTPTPSTDFGDGDDFGSGWGSGDGTGGGGFGNIPTTMKKRCSKADRMDRLKETGGTPECEEAVVKGLNWLKATQSKEGNWPGNIANTGLALLAYLGHCETPISEDYGETVLRAMTYLINTGMKNKGWLATGQPATNRQICYQHAINTYAIAEATTFCRQLKLNVPNLDDVCQKAGQLIIDNQTKEGGWEYGYAEISNRGGGDLSITAWQVQALKACKHTGLDFRNLSKCASRAIDHVESLAGPDGGFGYTSPGRGHSDYNTLTGAGVLCMQMWEKGSRAAARAGAKYIDKNTKFDYNTRFADLYGHYYEAQAMMNRGGEQWKRYNALFRDQLLKNQNADGSWKVPGGGQKLRAVAPVYTSDTHYRSCLCILMLETYYRFLPGTGAN